jgi:branched-chain amino acid transport system ATP-binding protein
MPDALAIEGLVAGYGRSQVLRGVSLALERGSNVGIVGPNGAGKSTLFKAISGVVRARSGTIVFDGQPLHTLKPDRIVKAGVVQVPEGRQVFPGLSVAENLWLGGYAAPHERERRREEVLELFPRLRERLDQAADSLSGGEQQMLAIGRGLMAAPRLLLLDEPTLGLAPVVVDQLIDALRTMSARFGVSLLVAEQSIQLTQELCSTVHVLVDGRITRSLRPGEADREAMMSAYLGQG